MMSCLCSAIWHKQSTSLVLMVDGNGPGFLGTSKELEPVENDVYSKLSRIMPMFPWSPPLFVVGTVASIAPSSRVSWFMSLSVGYALILVMSNFSRLSSMSCLIPMVEVMCFFCGRRINRHC